MRRAKRHDHDFGPRGVFITATDTGVGKTLVASALVKCLTQHGIDVGVMKPIETGVLQSGKAQSDGARLRRAAGVSDPMTEVCPYIFRLPVAPLSAARDEGTVVRVMTILRAFRTLRQKHTCMVVEGVGGVYTPVTQSLDIADLICQMKFPSIVVGHTELGGINHALLTLDALRRRKIHIVALFLNRPRPFRTKIARLQEQSTVHLLRRLAGVPVVGPLPYSSIVNRNWNEGLVRFAETAFIMRLANLVLTSVRGTISPCR